ncbi:hypothetical protein RDI58_006966 [Solanum bulbocastanum]|uniref:Uncharacterized protein n=1 Tax=Solanum bulbocastanum TaxID=147425 RepID=A0AAN8YLN6_SOLBU
MISHFTTTKTKKILSSQQFFYIYTNKL